MDTQINKEVLKKLSELARMELAKAKEEKLLKDLENIVNYFNELQGLDTTGIEAVSGGTHLVNISRSDSDKNIIEADNLLKQFPEKEKRFLRVPAVFE